MKDTPRLTQGVFCSDSGVGISDTYTGRNLCPKSVYDSNSFPRTLLPPGDRGHWSQETSLSSTHCVRDGSTSVSRFAAQVIGPFGSYGARPAILLRPYPKRGSRASSFVCAEKPVKLKHDDQSSQHSFILKHKLRWVEHH